MKCLHPQTKAFQEETAIFQAFLEYVKNLDTDPTSLDGAPTGTEVKGLCRKWHGLADRARTSLVGHGALVGRADHFRCG